MFFCNENCSSFKSFTQFHKTYVDNHFENSIEITKFKKFSDINFECLNISIFNPEVINLIPYEPLSLDKNLKVDAIKKGLGLLEKIRFQNLKSFDLNTNFFRNFQVSIDTEFYYSKFKILQNGKDSCQPNFSNSFWNFRKIQFASTLYLKSTCPRIFQFLKIDYLIFYGLSNSFVKRNILEFKSLENTSQNYKIMTLELNIFKSNLSRDLIEYNLFNNTDLIRIKGLINYVENNLFDKINSKIIHFFTEDYLSIFQDGGYWLNSFELITDTFQSDNFFEILIDNYKLSFTEENLCFFKHVQSNRAYLISFTTRYMKFTCTCTSAILFSTYLNLKNFKYKFKSHFTSTTSEFLDGINCLNSTFLKKCSEKVKKCDSKILYKTSTDYNLIYLSLKVEFYNIILSQTIILFGILSNLFSLIVLISGYWDKSLKKETSTGLYKLMIINSLINFVYFLINSFHIINRCVEINGIFCSLIYRNKISQYYMIFFVEYLGSILKFWSSLTLIAISIARLGLLSNKKYFKNYKINRFVISIIFIYSILINLDKLFTIIVNSNEFVLDFDFGDEFPDRNTYINSISRLRYGRNLQYSGPNTIIFYVLYFLNFAINDVVLYAILTCFDLGLYKTLRDKIQLKKLMGTKLSDFENLNFKVNFIIFLNTSILFGLRTFHLFINSYLFIIRLKSNVNNENLCYKYGKMCSNLDEGSEIFNLLANCYNIILFYNLNKTCKILCLNLLKNVNDPIKKRIQLMKILSKH
ncbi:unnamed protein product [Brachionus calyciflorus]|uniref:Uncharacterized protein n=1 Tax=Brachionus calyciflorus TaxID=104777 RepID=A0A814CXF6_9BILA|nr:unnamed protein product [Brachionus calyciflorus]